MIVHSASPLKKEPRQGVALITALFASAVLFGMLGLCFDLARVYIAKNELQTYADAASLAATSELDGTDEGVTRARDVGMTFPNYWMFGTESVPEPTVYFAEEPEGPWVEFPPSPPTGYRFAQVITEAPITLYFMPVFDGLRPKDTSSSSTQSALLPAEINPWHIQFGSGKTAFAFLLSSNLSTATVSGVGAAGQIRKVRFEQGLLPFSPDAHVDGLRDPVWNEGMSQPDPFYFERGVRYTMRWPPPGQRNQNNANGNPGACPGDILDPPFDPPTGASERGFIDIGVQGTTNGNSSSFIRYAIVNNVQSHPLEIGQPIVHVTGQRSTHNDALEERISQDTDPYSETFAEYLLQGAGNFRRVVYMPVNDPWNNNIVINFATFFLPPADEVCGSGQPTEPCCAEYIGPGLMFRGQGADDEVGVYVSRLIK